MAPGISSFSLHAASCRRNRYIIFLAKWGCLKLVDLPGVGSRIRERLLEQYGDEEKALQAVLNADVAGLCRALSERQALSSWCSMPGV